MLGHGGQHAAPQDVPGAPACRRVQLADHLVQSIAHIFSRTYGLIQLPDLGAQAVQITADLDQALRPLPSRLAEQFLLLLHQGLPAPPQALQTRPLLLGRLKAGLQILQITAGRVIAGFGRHRLPPLLVQPFRLLPPNSGQEGGKGEPLQLLHILLLPVQHLQGVLRRPLALLMLGLQILHHGGQLPGPVQLLPHLLQLGVDILQCPHSSPSCSVFVSGVSCPSLYHGFLLGDSGRCRGKGVRPAGRTPFPYPVTGTRKERPLIRHGIRRDTFPPEGEGFRGGTKQ